MKLNLSLRVEKEQLETFGFISQSEKPDFNKAGHIGTHFDVMNKEFSLENIVTRGNIFDISNIKSHEVKVEDLDLHRVCQNDFVIFHSGLLKKYGYGTDEYFSPHMELSDELIDYLLLDKKVSFIGADVVGIKGSKDHARIDQYCANNGVFIIENLDNLDLLLKEAGDKPFTVYTFPLNFHGFTGLPCRVVAEI